jgi:hypothetical protein
MRGVYDACHADAAVPGQRAGLVHRAVHGDVAQPVVSVDEGRRAPLEIDRHIGVALGEAVAQAIRIPGQQPDAMAVHPVQRGVQHRPCGGFA